LRFNLLLFLPKVLSWCAAILASKSTRDFFRLDALERREEAGTVLEMFLLVPMLTATRVCPVEVEKPVTPGTGEKDFAGRQRTD
jgi:hypothetical protein